MGKEMVLHLSDVVFRFLSKGKRNILDHVNLDIEAGTITVIMGSSGCGKSTLAAVVSGLYPENGGFLDSGEIELYGHPLSTLNQQERAKYLTVMFQNPDLQFCMNTLRKEMQFCMENICIPVTEMDGRIERAAEALKVTDLLDRELGSLSGGEKQKVALACLYVMESKCILLDECFANIDRSASQEILQMILQMKQEGRTIIAIDHQIDLWMEYADELIILGEGAVPIARGITKENLADYFPVFEEQGLFYPKERKREASGYAGCEDVISFENLTIRKGVPVRRRWGKPADPLPALLEETSAGFPKGRMTAVLGPSGIGKTTTFLSVLGQHPYEGKIFVEGREVSSLKHQELYRQIGIVFQNPANQFITQNVQEEVLASMRVWNKNLPEEEAQKTAAALLESYGLSRYHRYSPYMLSQGQQRRLAVLSVLTGGQKILLLDEPTYGQDYRSAMAIMSQLRERMEKDGLTVIFITHDVVLAETYADKIYRIEEKKLVEYIPSDKNRKNSVSDEAYNEPKSFDRKSNMDLKDINKEKTGSQNCDLKTADQRLREEKHED